ncbi:hypothetical protein Taro_038034 [Colocasia esculenta]|uniref:Uncharacterized protein n=1 Tax=Colocasia esculenta TaxID=4460 RepID=A0A843WL06_COLES|nr:hypothetical protein [Colocasia esculenta]
MSTDVHKLDVNLLLTSTPQKKEMKSADKGRFLLAAASGRVLARSFHSVLQVGYEMIEQLGTGSIHIQEAKPEVAWKRAESSVMLEHVQAHVAPTDVDPGAGLQWLPKILRSSPKVKRTGALLERVFMPCTMYFRYTRHKGGTSDLKVVKADVWDLLSTLVATQAQLSNSPPNDGSNLKTLVLPRSPHSISPFRRSRVSAPLTRVLSQSPSATTIAATSDSGHRQSSSTRQVNKGILTTLPEEDPEVALTPFKACLIEEDDDVEEEADEVVPDGVEEVELAKINLEQRERERKLLLDDIRTLLASGDIPRDAVGSSIESNNALWMISGGKSLLAWGAVGHKATGAGPGAGPPALDRAGPPVPDRAGPPAPDQARGHPCRTRRGATRARPTGNPALASPVCHQRRTGPAPLAALGPNPWFGAPGRAWAQHPVRRPWVPDHLPQDPPPPDHLPWVPPLPGHPPAPDYFPDHL